MAVAIPALFEAVAAVGTTVAGAGTAAGGLAAFLPSASTALTILSGAASGFSALAAMGKGTAERAAKESQAVEYEDKARSEGVIEETQAAKARRSLVDTLGKQVVGYAASGIDLSAGTVKVAGEQASAEAEQDLSTSRAVSEMRQASYRRRAASLRAEGALAYSTSQLEAGGQFAKFGIDVLKRG
jgi:hypothetical protein